MSKKKPVFLSKNICVFLSGDFGILRIFCVCVFVVFVSKNIFVFLSKDSGI